MAYTINPQTGEATLVASLSASEKDLLVQRVTSLKAENAPGVTMDQLRAFYPNWDWTEVKLHLTELVEAGVLVRKMHKPLGAKVAYEYFGVVG
jgi:hypothetical protein